ncbi:hypothetical protein RJ44_02030 [Alteromonas macleodii]|uniref:hypothetical protein n=1 Tax=Alteromonas macleodii TaxID=28108 RepID=UPI00057C7705|nr:hypothetical protein [Alteromonas macleodii]KHT61025.1 hypothetical protein RJ44_02030 [Alteromonas macleodii]
MNPPMMKRRLLCPAKIGFTGNIHNFDEYTSNNALVWPTITKMSSWLGINDSALECWLDLQNVPTKADFFVVALRTHPKLRIFFNHHIEESFDFVFSLEKEAFKEWLEESFLQKLVRGGLITSDDVATLLDKV